LSAAAFQRFSWDLFLQRREVIVGHLDVGRPSRLELLVHALLGGLLAALELVEGVLLGLFDPFHVGELELEVVLALDPHVEHLLEAVLELAGHGPSRLAPC